MSDEIEYLKKLVAQLNDKITVLEGKTKEKAKEVKDDLSHSRLNPAHYGKEAKGETGSKTAGATTGTLPVQELRMILVGPPGAGTYFFPSVFRLSPFASSSSALLRLRLASQSGLSC